MLDGFEEHIAKLQLMPTDLGWASLRHLLQESLFDINKEGQMNEERLLSIIILTSIGKALLEDGLLGIDRDQVIGRVSENIIDAYRGILSDARENTSQANPSGD
jgi:hypothetical protein